MTISICIVLKFLSTLSLRRATTVPLLPQTRKLISIHALLAESDRSLRQLQSSLCYFYPRSPCGERHQILDDTSGATEHFYPRSPCGERLVKFSVSGSAISISIHALLAESDAVVDNIVFVPGQFLSTLSLRRATVSRFRQHKVVKFISIHALLAESDSERVNSMLTLIQFLSTLSLRRATLMMV